VAGDRASGTYYADGYGEAGAEGNDFVGNAGVSPIFTPPSVTQIEADAAKEVDLEQMMPAVLQNLALNAGNVGPLPTTLAGPGASISTCPQLQTATRAALSTSCYNPPASYQASQPITYQKQYWSCGSASTELWWWFKYGTDPGESTWYQQEQTYYANGKHAGTSSGLIAETIDDREGTPQNPAKDVGESKPKPDGPTLQGMVVTDEWKYNEAVIANVDTGDLPYWVGPDHKPHAYGHFVTLYGWDSDGSGHIYVADTYDTAPNTTSGAGGQNYNPYGYHPVLSSVVASAVDDSADHNVVW
jgi:hypothetical protein